MILDKKTWMSLFIAVIMIVSVIGFSLSFAQPAEKLEYNDYTFVRTAQGLQTKVNNIKLYFYHFPRDLEDIPFADGAKTALGNARVLWFSYDSNDLFGQESADALYYIEEVLGTLDKTYVQRGLVNNTGYQLPEITCANASAAVPVLILKSGNETAISFESNCIIGTAASDKEVYQVGDRLLYQALGVMH